MKKLLLLPLLMGLSLGLFAQKYAYIDSEYILGNMPSYVEAQAELNRLSINWQNEIEAKFKEIDAMYRKYQQESVLLKMPKSNVRKKLLPQKQQQKNCKRNVSVQTAICTKNAKN